jgi:hypothetical protein
MSKMIRVPRLANHSIDDLPHHALDQHPWPAYSAGPATSFAIGHTDTSILLKFFVDEDSPRVTYRQPNDPVYKDSCVEFFISFDKGSSYYNMEWNAAGTCLMAYGATRNNRTLLPGTAIQKILTTPGWPLSLQIPIEVFTHETLGYLSGISATANFYKCGDDCPEPHYRAWNNILTPAPDYHQPRYFGELLFL